MFANGAETAAMAFVLQWGAQQIQAGGGSADSVVTAKKSSGGEKDDTTQSQSVTLADRVKEIAHAIDLPERYVDSKFASAEEIMALTKGQAAWGTVTTIDGQLTIVMDKSLAGSMDGTRFTQTVAEELVHAEQIGAARYGAAVPRQSVVGDRFPAIRTDRSAMGRS